MVDVQTIGVVVTAASVSVAAIYYIFTLRTNQRNFKLNLETRQAQLFMSSMFERISSPEFRRAEKILEKYKPKTTEDLKQVFSDPEAFAAWGTVWWVYEGLGVLVHEGLVDIRLVARYIGGHYKTMWETWGPTFIARRVESDANPRMGVESEYLYNRLIEFGRKNPDYHII